MTAQMRLMRIGTKTKPGVYVPTPITVSSTWPNVKPFALSSPSQFRPEPPVALKSEQWAADYNEIKDSAARPAASVPPARPKMPASGSSPGRRAPNRSCAKSWRPRT